MDRNAAECSFSGVLVSSYDADHRHQKVELIIEKKPWTPHSHRFKDDTLVPVRIGYGDKDLREKAKAAQGKWDTKTRVWHIQFGKIKGTDLRI